MKKILVTAAVLGMAGFATAAGETFDIDISGINSWDGYGSPDNEHMSFDLAAALGLAPGTAVTMNGFGYDVNLYVGDSASWYSEARIGITDDVDGGTGLFLTPGFEDAENGTDIRNYSSGGVVKLVDVGIDDIVITDGMLELNFFEGFDDAAGVIDGTWMSGSIITIQVVPAPGAFAMLGLAGIAARRRRRG